MAIRRPSSAAFTVRERRLIARLRTPLAVQRYLNQLQFRIQQLEKELRKFKAA